MRSGWTNGGMAWGSAARAGQARERPRRRPWRPLHPPPLPPLPSPPCHSPRRAGHSPTPRTVCPVPCGRPAFSLLRRTAKRPHLVHAPRCPHGRARSCQGRTPTHKPSTPTPRGGSALAPSTHTHPPPPPPARRPQGVLPGHNLCVRVGVPAGRCVGVRARAARAGGEVQWQRRREVPRLAVSGSGGRGLVRHPPASDEHSRPPRPHPASPAARPDPRSGPQ